MKKIGLMLSLALLISGLSLTAYPLTRDARFASFQKASGMERSGEAGLQQKVLIPDGSLCVLEIPKIGLRVTVLEGTSEDVLSQAPGHYEETAQPDGRGNCCIAGHRNICGSPFMDLDQLNKGDRLTLYTRGGKRSYEVVETKIVDDTDLSVIEPSEDTRLTLTTCERQGEILKRLIVISRLIEG